MKPDSTQERLVLPGTVFALGLQAGSAAKLYAQLTGRPCRICNSLSDLTASQNDVVVCTTNELTPQLMYKLYVDGPSRGIPGLIFASTPTLLDAVCRSQAAKLAWKRAVNPRRIFVHTKLGFSAVSRGTDLFISGQEPLDSLLPLLSSRASILSIFAHSDGISLDISHNSVLCPFVDLPPDPDEELRPSCQVTDRCTKFPVMPSIQDAKKAGWILPLKAVRAEIGIIVSCAAVRLRDGVVDPAYGLAASLLHQADFGAIVTTWRKEPGTADGVHVNALINELSGGKMVGVAAAGLNRSAFCAKFGVKFCVVGDPCFALPGDTTYAQLPAFTEALTTHSSESPAPKDENAVRAALLKDCILQSLKSNPAYDVSEGETLASELAAYAKSVIANWARSDLLSQIDRRLLKFLSSFPWLPGFFQQLSWIDSFTENVPCPVCFAPSRVFHLIFPGRSAELKRQLNSCSNCGDVEDMPVEWQIALDLTQLRDGFFSISGVPPGTQLLVCFANFWGSLYRATLGEVSQDGSFSCRVPTDLPPVPMFCRLLFARSLELGALSFKLRQTADGTYKSTTLVAESLEDEEKSKGEMLLGTEPILK